MRASDVPRILRESPEVARAREEGQRAGRAGVAADQNPWREKAPEYRAGVSMLGGAWYHAVRYTSSYSVTAMCGPFVAPNGYDFNPAESVACKRCIRAVEAERKRRERAWESGRLSTHPK